MCLPLPTAQEMTSQDFKLPLLEPQLLQWRDEVVHGRGFFLLKVLALVLPSSVWSTGNLQNRPELALCLSGLKFCAFLAFCWCLTRLGLLCYSGLAG